MLKQTASLYSFRVVLRSSNSRGTSKHRGSTAVLVEGPGCKEWVAIIPFHGFNVVTILSPVGLESG